MAWRKWLVRSLVFTTAAGLAVAAFFYQRWTDPEKVRHQVLDQLSKRFVGARVSADSAQFQLFGGITVSDVRFARHDDMGNVDVVSIPRLTLYLDKEQLLHGQQKVRKLELDRPRLRLVRDSTGQWNFEGLLPPVDLNEAIPTIVIHHGTIWLEDRLAAPQVPPLEIKDVNLTILNDPILMLSVAGSGSSDLGPVQIAATHHRASGDTKVTLDALAVPVGPALVQRLDCYVPKLAMHARQLEGIGKLHVELGYQPNTPTRCRQNVHFQLRQGKLVHARLPMRLEQLEASVHYLDGQVPSVKVSARAGAAKADLSIKDLNYLRLEEGLEQAIGELSLQVEHLPLTRDLLASAPQSLAGLNDLERDYVPRGPVSLDVTIQRDAGGGWRKHCIIKPEDVCAECSKFPYLLEHITGIIEQDGGSSTPDVVRLDLVGRAGERPITIRGEVRHLVPNAGASHEDQVATADQAQAPPTFVSVEIRGENLPLDDKLMAALLPKGQTASKAQELARKFQPRGLADFQAFIHRDGRSRQFANRFLIHFHHAALRYKVFPYPLDNVIGALDIHPDHWEFRDFSGSHKGGEFRGKGRSIPSPDGERAEVFIDGTNLLLDEELKAALDEDLQRTWTKLSPAGRVDFAARIDIPPGARERPTEHDAAPANMSGPGQSGVLPRKPEIDLQVQMRGCTIRPDFFKYTLRDLTGKARYAKRWVMLDDVQGRHGSSVITLKDGLVYTKEGGGVWAQLGRLHGTPLVPDDELLKALPDCLAKACRCLHWRDPVQLESKLVIDTRPDQARPVIYWDGTATFHNAMLKTGVDLSEVSGKVACLGLHDGHQLQGLIGNLALEQATIFKQPLRAIQGRLEVTKDEPDILKVPGLYAQFCGGEVYGPIRVEFGPTIRYELNLTASRVKLEEFARQNPGLKSELSGEAAAQVYLAGRGDHIDDLKGNGRIDVPKGKIENLPPLVNLLKFLALRLPDRTAFEEGHAEFEIQGPRARVTRLDLFGNAISLRGQGDLRLDGSDLNLDFNADWARFAQVLPPGIKQIPPAISNQLLRIKMRGSVDDPKFHKDFVPLVTDPVKKMWNEVKGQPPPGQIHSSMGKSEW